MQERILQESHHYIRDLEMKVQHSDELASVFKDYITNIHQSFRTLSMQLNEHTEQLFTSLARQPEENELNLFHFTQLSNLVVGLSQTLDESIDELLLSTIEPYETFLNNYKGINGNLITSSKHFLHSIESQRESLHIKQQEYLKAAYELEKKKKSATLKLKAEDLFVDYRQELCKVNVLWDSFNDKFKDSFDQYDLNDLGRTQMTQNTSTQVVSLLQKMLQKLSNTISFIQEQSKEKMTLIQQKHNSEKQPILKHIARGRKFNVFKITKHDNFITYEDWRKNCKDKDPSNLQKFKLEQSLEYQISQILSFMRNISNQTNQELQLDFETLCQNQTVRIKLLEGIQEVIDNGPSSCVVLESIAMDQACIIARALIINIQKDEFSAKEFYYLLLFLISYVKKDKGLIICLGALASEKTSLLYERHNWQSLLLYLNDKEELKQSYDLSSKISTKDVLSLLYQKKRKVTEQLTHDQKIYYLKVLSNLQRLSQIMLKLNLKLDFACETIIVLSKMCNIRVSDIVLLLEQFESIKIYEESLIRSGGSGRNKQKQYYVFKKCLKYLNLSDQIRLTTVNKELSQLQQKVRQYYLCNNHLYDGMTVRRQRLWISCLGPREMDYFKLKERYSRTASSKEASIEQLIAQDVSRSFNCAGVQSKINHLSLHNLLKLYAYYNSTVSYTQGMNFVMGFLFLVMEQEELTFRCFIRLIDLLLKDVLLEDLKHIRVFFYKLDRLLAIHLPLIHQHLKDEKIEAGHYAAPWFITLFSGSYMKNEFSNVLYDIWDLLLAKGWSGYYQILLAIFQTYEEKILSMKFDNLLQFLNNLSKAEFFTQNTDEIASLKTLKYRALRFRVTKKTLQDLDKEYYLVRQKINYLMNY